MRYKAVCGGDHTMHVKERQYEKVGADFEQVYESIFENHPAFVDEW